MAPSLTLQFDGYTLDHDNAVAAPPSRRERTGPVRQEIAPTAEADDAHALFFDAAGPPTDPSRLTIQLAGSDDHHQGATALLRKMYEWRGYRIAPLHSRPHCATLVAAQDGRTLATVTVGFDSPTGLSAGDLYPEQVARLRGRGARLCEITALAVERIPHSRKLLGMMFNVAYRYARRLHGRTDALIEVNPRHARFYSRAMGFRRIGDVRICPRVSAPAVLMWLPLRHMEEQLAQAAVRPSGGSRDCSLFSLSFSPDEEAEIAAHVRQLD